MEKLLVEFINTLDLSFKKLQEDLGIASGFSRLTINQFRYIDAIFELGEPTVTAIAGHLNITKASVTSGVAKLVQMGYVAKTQSDEDKRVFYVSLTEAGRHLIRAKYQALEEYVLVIRAALSQEEIRQFEKILIKIIKLIQQA